MSQAFNSLTPEYRQQRQLAHQRCRTYSRDPSKGHLKQLKQLFSYCGELVVIEPGFHCDYGKIELGDRVFININNTFLDGGLIKLGNDCLVGPNVQILTVSHSTDPTERLNKSNYAKDVIIGNNVWIGTGAIILPGVAIGDNAVIGAGSVVTKTVKENQIVAGNPAMIIRGV